MNTDAQAVDIIKERFQKGVSIVKLLHTIYVTKKLSINPGYAYILSKKLEKRCVLKGMKDPVNGKLAFKPSTSKQPSS